jgi:hypothetical protein
MEIVVDLQLRASYSLNLVTDESTNIFSYKIINTFVITNNYNYFYILNVKEVRKLRAINGTDHVVKIVKKIIYKDFSK